MKEKNKGITLIVLVITIIVLIILSGVSISLVLGDNGIITKVKQAKRETLNSQVEEQEKLNEVVEYLENEGNRNQNTDKVVIQGPVEGGNYDTPYIPTGFTHTEGEGTWNSGYVIKETATGNEFVWVPCVSDQSKVKTGDTVVTFGKTTTGKYNKDNLGLLPTDTSVEAEDSSVEEIETSVGRYGGFYIAKYEAGLNGEVDESTSTSGSEEEVAKDGSVKPLSQAGKRVWRFISRADAITVSKAMMNENTGVKSTLISGAAWDTTLQWMVNASDNKNKEPNLGYDQDSTGNGCYNDVSSDIVTTTGQYGINNIYDMAGNVYEFTTENAHFTNGELLWVVRGGASYEPSGSDYPASCRSLFRENYGGVQWSYIGFRVVLYK